MLITTVVIMGLLLVGLALTHALMVRWTRRVVRHALRRERRALSDREEVINFLNRFVSGIITSRTTDEWMWQVARYLGEIIGAQAMRIFVLDDKELRRVAATGKLPEKVDDTYRLTRSNRLLDELNRQTMTVNEGVVGEVVLTGKSVIENNFEGNRKRHAHEHIDSFMAVPLVIDRQPIGVVCAVNKRRKGQAYSSNDLFLLETLAHQVALGDTLIRAFDELSEQQRIQQELQLAQRIQSSLLPREAPESDSFAIHAVNKPALEVSGDYYDFFEVDEHTLLVLVADASGKGVPACMLMATCRSLVRNNAGRFKNNLEGLLRELNQTLFEDTDPAQFVTMGCCLIDRRDGTVEYARAGHTELLVRTPRGNVQTIVPDGPALGLLPNEMGLAHDPFYFSLLPGMSLMLFSDGITEAVNDSGEEFGLERLIDKWRQLDPEPVAATSRILKELDDFTHPCMQEDDQTLVILTCPADMSTATG